MTSEWRKSSYSDTGGQCVECRTYAGTVAVRDTQNREHGHIAVPAREWAALIADIRAGHI
ncbi:DUF397 domain-containing protein [Nocardiopsis sp. CNT-189]|uniref:DUF397 domain-containing protein n=1 Tax=Nocardiopsis oceanisediminis TaxID=2816862 RepID=UPI003B31B5BF